MINMQTLRNKTIDRVVNVLNSAKYVPNKHDVALNAILNDEATTDDEKLAAMRTYFHDAVQTVIDNA